MLDWLARPMRSSRAGGYLGVGFGLVVMVGSSSSLRSEPIRRSSTHSPPH